MTSIIDFGESPNCAWFDGYKSSRINIETAASRTSILLGYLGLDNLLALEAGEQTVAFFDELDEISGTPYNNRYWRERRMTWTLQQHWTAHISILGVVYDVVVLPRDQVLGPSRASFSNDSMGKNLVYLVCFNIFVVDLGWGRTTILSHSSGFARRAISTNLVIDFDIDIEIDIDIGLEPPTALFRGLFCIQFVFKRSYFNTDFDQSSSNAVQIPLLPALTNLPI